MDRRNSGWFNEAKIAIAALSFVLSCFSTNAWALEAHEFMESQEDVTYVYAFPDGTKMMKTVIKAGEPLSYYVREEVHLDLDFSKLPKNFPRVSIWEYCLHANSEKIVMTRRGAEAVLLDVTDRNWIVPQVSLDGSGQKDFQELSCRVVATDRRQLFNKMRTLLHVECTLPLYMGEPKTEHTVFASGLGRISYGEVRDSKGNVLVKGVALEQIEPIGH